MAEGYVDNPYNIQEIMPWIITGKDQIISEIFSRKKCCFYDACSFRRHSKLKKEEAGYLLKHMKTQDTVLVITRCILMELASHSGILNQEYMEYIKYIREYGIPVVVLYEEDIFFIMEMVFNTNAAINNYLCWAVRLLKGPVSTITYTIENNAEINKEVMQGKNLNSKEIYRHFFETVRKNKESGDNLGEEILAVCLHILANIPGKADEKFYVITDDKGAAGKIDNLFKRTRMQYRGKEIGIYSTPKLVQVLFRKGILTEKDHIREIMSAGISGNLVVLGIRKRDIRVKEISSDAEELADMLMQPDGIDIIF